jgi:hypothetical protein
VAHSARVHDYWLGGKDNFAADRAAGDAVMAAYPGIVESVRATRAFLARAVRFLAQEAGITQFLDIGTGIPAVNNTHEVAQAVTPTARVVYVDYDPVVLQHACAASLHRCHDQACFALFRHGLAGGARQGPSPGLLGDGQARDLGIKSRRPAGFEVCLALVGR